MQLKSLLGVSHAGGHDQWTDPHFHSEELQREERYAQQQQQLQQQQQQQQNQQDQQAEQWMRENGQGRDKIAPSLRDMIQDDQSDPYGRSAPRPLGVGQGLGQGQGAIKPLNGARGMSYAQAPPPLGQVYAQAPPPLGKNRIDAGSPANLMSNLIDWSESQLSIISDRADIFTDRVEKLQFRGVVEHCCKLESPAEVRDVFCRYMNSSASSPQVISQYTVVFAYICE